jgi:hypothetical protein
LPFEIKKYMRGSEIDEIEINDRKRLKTCAEDTKIQMP